MRSEKILQCQPCVEAALTAKGIEVMGGDGQVKPEGAVKNIAQLPVSKPHRIPDGGPQEFKDCAATIRGSLVEITTSDSLWSVEDVCLYLKVQKQTVYNWVHRKKIPCRKASGILRFEKKKIDEWMTSREVCYEPKEVA